MHKAYNLMRIQKIWRLIESIQFLDSKEEIEDPNKGKQSNLHDDKKPY